MDGSKGGLNALLQSALCTNEIGWDDNARKIVLFTTDAGFHIAGDGPVDGFINRFQEQCSLRKVNDTVGGATNIWEYADSDQLDYPSVGQVICMS